MTVANTNVSSSYNCNGVTREFNIGFHYNSTLSGLIIVVLHADGTSTTVTANYEIEDNVLTYPTLESELDPLPEGDVITISRVTPLTQSINLVQQGPLDAEVLEGGYDKATLQIQEVANQKQDKLIAGENIVIDEDGTISATGEVVEGVNWGNIHGTLSNQTDLQSALATKQDTLVSGTNIKTINNNSIVGSGNVDIDALPSQTGNSGKFLTTNGTTASWEAIGSGMPLFYHTFADHLFSDTSWLRADTFSWQDGAVYVSAYNHLVADIDGITAETETIAGTTITFKRATDGHKIVDDTQVSNVEAIFTATGVAWYYVLDTANTRFKLPRSQWNLVGLRDSVGNYVAESLPNITGTGLYWENAIDTASQLTGPFYVDTTRQDCKGSQATDNDNYSVAMDLNRGNSTYQNNAPVQQRATQMYLYFYVGNTVQGQTTIDVGQITEALNNKAETDLSNVPASKGFLVESYVNGTSWYRVYSDGWCEQGGTVSGGYVQVQLFKTYANANYNIQVTMNSTVEQTAAYAAIGTRGAVAASYFELWGGDNNGYKFWRTCGYTSLS